MTRKDYRLIAEAMAKAKGNAFPWSKAVDALADMLKADNPNFNKMMFVTACMAEGDK